MSPNLIRQIRVGNRQTVRIKSETKVTHLKLKKSVYRLVVLALEKWEIS